MAFSLDFNTNSFSSLYADFYSHSFIVFHLRIAVFVDFKLQPDSNHRRPTIAALSRNAVWSVSTSLMNLISSVTSSRNHNGVLL